MIFGLRADGWLPVARLGQRLPSVAEREKTARFSEGYGFIAELRGRWRKRTGGWGQKHHSRPHPVCPHSSVSHAAQVPPESDARGRSRLEGAEEAGGRGRGVRIDAGRPTPRRMVERRVRLGIQDSRASSVCFAFIIWSCGSALVASWFGWRPVCTACTASSWPSGEKAWAASGP